MACGTRVCTLGEMQLRNLEQTFQLRTLPWFLFPVSGGHDRCCPWRETLRRPFFIWKHHRIELPTGCRCRPTPGRVGTPEHDLGPRDCGKIRTSRRCYFAATIASKVFDRGLPFVAEPRSALTTAGPQLFGQGQMCHGQKRTFTWGW